MNFSKCNLNSSILFSFNKPIFLIIHFRIAILPGSANLMMKSYPKDNEIFSHSNKAKNRVFNEDFFIVF